MLHREEKGGKGGMSWMFSSGRLSLCLLGHQGWQGLRLDQGPSSAKASGDRREKLPGQKLSERKVHPCTGNARLHPRDKALCSSFWL